jgi:hypothetical protein
MSLKLLFVALQMPVLTIHRFKKMVEIYYLRAQINPGDRRVSSICGHGRPRFYIDGTGFIDFCEKFKYLCSILHYSLTSDADVDKRITSATAAFGALKNIFADKYLSEELKGEVYKALILPTLLYGCEAWSSLVLV